MDVLYGGAVNVLGAASTASSIGAIAALKDKDLLKSNYERLERRRRLAYEVLSTTPGVKMKMSESGILSWLDVSALGTCAAVSYTHLDCWAQVSSENRAMRARFSRPSRHCRRPGSSWGQRRAV